MEISRGLGGRGSETGVSEWSGIKNSQPEKARVGEARGKWSWHCKEGGVGVSSGAHSVLLSHCFVAGSRAGLTECSQLSGLLLMDPCRRRSFSKKGKPWMPESTAKSVGVSGGWGL